MSKQLKCPICRKQLETGDRAAVLSNAVINKDGQVEEVRVVGTYHHACHARSTINPNYVLKNVFGMTQKELNRMAVEARNEKVDRTGTRGARGRGAPAERS